MSMKVFKVQYFGIYGRHAAIYIKAEIIKGSDTNFLTIITRKILNCHILDRNLFEEVGLLAARVPCHNAFFP